MNTRRQKEKKSLSADFGMINQTLPSHPGVQPAVSLSAPVFLICQPPPPAGLLSLLR